MNEPGLVCHPRFGRAGMSPRGVVPDESEETSGMDLVVWSEVE